MEKEYQALLPGVRILTAATLVAELPELGQIDGKTAAALAGLAHWSRDSGRQQSRRSIRGGRGRACGSFTGACAPAANRVK